MGELRIKMEHDLVIRGLSKQTGKAYLRAVEGLTRHYGRAPDTLGLDEVKAYLSHLRQERQVTLSNLGSVVSGLRFFYEATLGRPRQEFLIPSPTQPQPEPYVLSRPEVERTKDTFVSFALAAEINIYWLEQQTGVAYSMPRRHYGAWMPSGGRNQLRRFEEFAASHSSIKRANCPPLGRSLGGNFR